ncbi:MAG: coproporphyrinogen-III oxidase family protein [Elusimicrobiota bacterium]|nr:coproporphyrinogen-III oxidase family protein [Elusimicrobiota bacterium]
MFERVLGELHSNSLPYSPPVYPPAQAWEKLTEEDVIRNAWQNTIRQKGHLDLYVHIPFCASRCTFCGLYSKRLKKSEEIDAYLTALEKEVKILSSMLAPGKIDGLRIGGGTPSLLSPKQIKRLYDMIFKNFEFSSDRFSDKPAHGVVFESHPRFLTPKKLKVLKEEGTHWIAMGVQSLDDDVLAKTNRMQKAEDVFRAYSNIREAGIPFIANDLIYGLEGQTVDSFCHDIEKLIKMKADRVVMYAFSPTRLTPSSKDNVNITKKHRETIARMEEEGFNFLKSHGYIVKDEFHEYWGSTGGLGDKIYTYTYDEYDNTEKWHSILSLGAGAMSVANANLRYQNHISVPAYIKSLEKGLLPIRAGVQLTEKINMLNHIIMNFINSSRVLYKQFEIEFGSPIDETFKNEMEGLISQGLVKRKKTGYFIVAEDQQRIVVGEDRYRIIVEVSRAFFEPKVVEKLKKFFKIDKKKKTHSVISLKNYDYKKVLIKMIRAKKSGYNNIEWKDIPSCGLDVSLLKAADKLNLYVKKQ